MATNMSTLMIRHALTALALGLLGATVGAQDVGTLLYDDVELDDLTQTGAKSYEDLYGRAVLIEFFAYW